MNSITSRFVVVLIALGSVAAAEKEKRADVSDYPFWTMKKRGFVAQFVPGLTAALELTDAQVQQIAAAREVMWNDDAVKAARGLPKGDPAAQQGRAAVDAATAQMREKVAAVLTPAQRALIEQINGLYAAAVEETALAHEERFASVKGDEAARRRLQEEVRDDVEEQFRHKLDRELTAEQKAAMTRAAGEEERRKASAVKQKAAK